MASTNKGMANMWDKQFRYVSVAAAFDMKMDTRRQKEPPRDQNCLLTSGRVLFLLGWIHLKTLDAMLKGRVKRRAHLFDLFPTGLGEPVELRTDQLGPASQTRTSAGPSVAPSQSPGGCVDRSSQHSHQNPQAASQDPGLGHKSSLRSPGKSGHYGSKQRSPARRHFQDSRSPDSLIRHARELSEASHTRSGQSSVVGSHPCSPRSRQKISPRPSLKARFIDPVQALSSDDPQDLRDWATQSSPPDVPPERQAAEEHEKRLQQQRAEVAEICQYLRSTTFLNPTLKGASRSDPGPAAKRRSDPTTRPLREYAASHSMFYRLDRFENSQRLAFQYLITNAERAPEPVVLPDIALHRIFSGRRTSDRTCLESTFFLVILCWLVECEAFHLPAPIRGQIIQGSSYSEVVRVIRLREEEDLQPMRGSDFDFYIPLFYPQMLRVFVYPALRLLPLFLEVTQLQCSNPRVQQAALRIPLGDVLAQTSSQLDLLNDLAMWQTLINQSGKPPQ